MSAAALRLFTENGYESTTVDQIAAAAGVARRTFFRYFATKEDAVFPDHDSTVEVVSQVLSSGGTAENPLDVVSRGIREVLRMYASDAATSLARYRLLRQVPTLREREIAVVSRYERLFTRYLLAHPSMVSHSSSPDAALLAEVSAAAVVAAHNHVLRHWLRNGAESDALHQLDSSLSTVRKTFVDRQTTASQGDDVVVTVTRANGNVDDILAAVRNALS